MGSISDSLAGKNEKDRARVKASTLADTEKVRIKNPTITVDGYTVTITGRTYDEKAGVLVITFTATGKDGREVDLDGPYRYHNPPVKVYDETVGTFKEDPEEAIRHMVRDTVLYVLHSREQK